MDKAKGIRHYNGDGRETEASGRFKIFQAARRPALYQTLKLKLLLFDPSDFISPNVADSQRVQGQGEEFPITQAKTSSVLQYLYLYQNHDLNIKTILSILSQAEGKRARMEW